ncbi:MAG: deoxynucleoside kinase [Candidatus Firestonebacteria bacterium]|nr:deoxynucleoside kinase [Candidatus Firestonebacteria bacterium]
MQSYSFIAIEGPIGVGKTTLVHLLSGMFNAREVLEVVEDNPFLENFYKNMHHYAFQTQIFFLLSRYKQLEELLQPELFENMVITDYILDKDKIFAMVTLDEDELAMYNHIYPLLDKRIPSPDLVIYLQASTDVLWERIKRRNRHFEKNITKEYLKEINQAYDKYFFNYIQTPLLVINTNDVDYVSHYTDLEDLAKQIIEMGKGTKYYVPKLK